MSVNFRWRPKGKIAPWSTPLVKHAGPGPHPGTGSDQSIHGSRLVNPATGSGQLNKLPISKVFTNPDGSPWTYTASHKGPLLSNGIDITDRYQEVVDDMMETAKENGISVHPRTLDKHLNRLLDSAVARYADNPQLIDQDRFYELWHESLFNLSRETDIEMSRIVAAASAISPGLDAERNLHFTHDLARMVDAQDEIVFSGPEAQVIADHLRSEGQDILKPRWNSRFHKLPPGVKDGDLRPPPPAILQSGQPSARYLQGQALVTSADLIEAKGEFSVADLDAYSAAYVLHGYRKSHGPMGTLHGRVASLYSEPPTIMVSTGTPSGFDVPKGFDNYEKAIAVLRGDIAPIDAMGDVKTRSFHNNILDPYNAEGRSDVTVDFHSINFTTFSFGADNNTALSGTPSLEGLNLGVRPLVADAIRRASVRYADRLPDGHIPSRIQEIAWAEWRRGLATKPVLGWTSYTRESYRNLPYTGKGIWRQEEQKK